MSDHGTDIARVLDLIDPATIVADASSLILARGENPAPSPAETELMTVRVLETIASRLGGRTRRTDVDVDRPNLSVRFGPDEPGILFLGHSDVVPAGEGWTEGPFSPRVVDGNLFGRGSTDMKGGIAAVMQAMAAVHRVRPDVPLELLVTVDEEDLATGIVRHLDDPPRAYAACIVAEPTDLATVIACRGAANLEIDVHGSAAHAGRPEDGVNAITAAASIALAIQRDHERLRAASRGMLGSATWNVGRIEGGHGTSIVPDRCTLLVDRRLMPGETGEVVLAQLEALLAAIPELERCDVRARLLMEMPGFETEASHPLVADAVAALAADGRASAIEAWTAACEGGFVARHHGCPTIILGPGDITGQAHQPDERVAIADLDAAARAYARLAIQTYDRTRARASAQPRELP